MKPSGRILGDVQRSSTPGVTRNKNKFVPWESLYHKEGVKHLWEWATYHSCLEVGKETNC